MPANPLTKTIKTPETLYRQGTSELDEDGNIIRMSISSDTPYLRYDWWNDEEYYEVLDHGTKGVDLARIENGASLLFNHDRDVQLGTISKPEIQAGKCYVEARLSEAPDVASHRIRIKERILKDASVGYNVAEEGECIGEKDGIPIYKFRWFPHEASLVTIAADFKVGVGRQRDHKPEGEPREVRIRAKIEIDSETPPPQKATTATNPMPETLTPPDNQPKVKTEAELTAEIEARYEREEKRKEEVRAIAAKFPKWVDDETRDAFLGDKTRDPRDLHGIILAKQNKQTESPDGRSYIEVVGERGSSGNRALTIGEEFMRSAEVKGLNGKIRKGGGVSVEIPGISTLGIKGKVALAQRAGFTSSDLSGVNVTLDTSILPLGVQRLTIMDVIGSGSIGTGSYKYARENSFGSINGTAVAAGAMPRGQAVGERGVKPNWEPDLSTETATVSKIAVTTKVPDEFLSDFPSAMSYINDRLPFMVDTETEYEILYGDGLNNRLEGIFTTAGVQTRAITTTNDTTIAASLRQGLTDIQVGAFFEPDFFGFHPYDWETAQLLKDDDKRFFAGGPYYIPYTNGVFQERHTFWGKPVVISTAITYGQPIAGAGKIGAAALIREGMRIEMTNSNEDDFIRNLICLRAEHRLALPVYRPVAFIQFTGFPARA